ncbi:MAG TPA: hypothetical protein VI094_11120 [Propionibacteriaceae bacterium]
MTEGQLGAAHTVDYRGDEGRPASAPPAPSDLGRNDGTAVGLRDLPCVRDCGSRCVRRCGRHRGREVLVVGATRGVGQQGLQLAVPAGATVIATDASPSP